MRNLDDIGTEAARELRAALHAPDKSARAAAMRKVADAVVEARAYFTLADGSMDMLGRSYPYKQWAASLYTEAGVPREERRAIQNNLSYHVNHVLHERYGSEEVAAHGMSEKSLSERRTERRERELRIIHLFENGGPIYKTEDVLDVLSTTRNALRRFTPEVTPKALIRALDKELERVNAELESAGSPTE